MALCELLLTAPNRNILTYLLHFGSRPADTRVLQIQINPEIRFRFEYQITFR